MSTDLWNITDLAAAVSRPHDTALRALDEDPLLAVAWGLLDALMDVLSDDGQQELVRRLEAKMATAPTRPHPHTPHTALSPVLARVDAGVDRARDAMDNRVVDTGRPARAARPLGRWGSYLMGTPYPRRDREEQG